MGIKDAYYSLEDKWFDLLDWLEDRRVPVYSIVDPLEKNGIPSLPVYAVLAILIGWFVVGGISFPSLGPGGGGEKIITFELKDQRGACVAGASLQVLKDGTVYKQATSQSSCNTKVSLAAGSYTVKAVKQTCTDVTTAVTVTQDKTVSLPLMNCVLNLSSEKQICTFPKGIGKISVIARNPQRIPQSSVNCDASGLCNLSTQAGWTYKFNAQGYASQEYNASDLEQLRKEDCVSLTKIDQPDEAGKGTVVVKLVDEKNQSVKWHPVRLVNPEDNSTDVVTPGTTDGSGSKIFKATIGTKFAVLVPASSTNTTLAAAISNESYEFGNETLEIEMQLNLAVPTKVIVKEGDKVVQGVLVKVFDGTAKISDPEAETDADGVYEFGGTPDKAYRVTLFLEGYASVEANITGGTENTVQITKISESETGWVEARTINKADQSPFPGITVSLYSLPEGGTARETAYPDQLTDGLGKAKFDWIMPGKYCITAKTAWGKPTTCSEHAVTIEKGKGALTQVIEVEPPKYIITVKVTTPDTAVAQGAKIRVFNYEGTKLEEKTADFEGLAFFELQKMRSATIIVEYKTYRAEERITVDADKQVNVKLEELDTKITLQKIIDPSTNANATEPLSAGNEYYFKFALGLPNTSSQRWDSVGITLSLKEGFTEFPEQLALTLQNKYPDLNFDVNAGDSAVTLKITGEYSPTNTTVYLDVPFKVTVTDTAEKLEKIEYSAKWTKAEYTKESSGSRIFRVVKAAYSDDGKFVIEKLVYKGGNSYALDPALEFNQSEIVTLWMRVTNSLPEFSGKIIFDAIVKSVAFQTPKITPSLGYAVLNDEKTTAEITVSNLKKNDSFVIEIPTVLVSPSNAIITTKVDGEEKTPAYQFKIAGNTQAYAELAPTKLGEFTTSAEIVFKDDTSGKEIPWTQISEIHVTGTSLVPDSCDYGDPTKTSRIKAKQRGTNAFVIDFTKDCPLKSRMGTFNITATSNEYKIEDSENKYTSCFSQTAGVSPQAEPYVSTDLTLSLYPQCTETVKQKDLKLTTDCNDSTKCVFANKNNKFSEFTDQTIPSPTVESNKIPLSFTYKALTDADLPVQAKFEYTAYSETSGGKTIERTYDSTRTITVQKSSAETCLEVDRSLFSGTRSVYAQTDLSLNVKVGVKDTDECTDTTKDITLTVHDIKLTHNCGGVSNNPAGCKFTNAGTTKSDKSFTLTPNDEGIPLSFKFASAPSRSFTFDANMTFNITIEAYDGEVKIEKEFNYTAASATIGSEDNVKINVLMGQPQYSGTYFKPLPMQRYGADVLDCAANWCTMDQVLQQLSAVNALACSPGQSSVDERTINNVHLVDMGSSISSATASDIANIAQGQYGNLFSQYLSSAPSSSFTGKAFVVSNAPDAISFMGGTAQYGIFTLSLKTTSPSSASCYRSLSLERTGNGPAGMAALELLLPTTANPANTEKFSANVGSDTELKGVVDTLWKEAGSTQTISYAGGRPVEKVSTAESPRIDYDPVNKKTKFSESSNALLTELINTLKAYLNPSDTIYATSLLVIDTQTATPFLTYGPAVFTFNVSTSDINTLGLVTPLTDLVTKQLSIDPSMVISVKDGTVSDSYGTFVILDDSNQPILGSGNSENYKNYFSTPSLFGPFAEFPEQAIITAAYTPGFTLFYFGKQTKITTLLNTLSGKTTAPSNVLKASDDLAFEYKDKTMKELQKNITKDPDFSQIVHTTGDCKLNGTRIGGAIKDKNGNAVELYPDSYYLITKKTSATTGEPLVYVHAFNETAQSGIKTCVAPLKPVTKVLAFFAAEANGGSGDNYKYKIFTLDSSGGLKLTSGEYPFAEVCCIYGGAISGTAYDTNEDGKDDELLVLYSTNADYIDPGSGYVVEVFRLSDSGIPQRPSKFSTSWDLDTGRIYGGGSAVAAYDFDGDGKKDKAYLGWSTGYGDGGIEYKIYHMALAGMYVGSTKFADYVSRGRPWGRQTALAYGTDKNAPEKDDKIFTAWSFLDEPDVIYKFGVFNIVNDSSGRPLPEATPFTTGEVNHGDVVGSAISAAGIDTNGDGVKEKIIIFDAINADGTPNDHYHYAVYNIKDNVIEKIYNNIIEVCCTIQGAVGIYAYDTDADADKIEDTLLVVYATDTDDVKNDGYAYKQFKIDISADGTIDLEEKTAETTFYTGSNLWGASVGLVPIHGATA